MDEELQEAPVGVSRAQQYAEARAQINRVEAPQVEDGMGDEGSGGLLAFPGQLLSSTMKGVGMAANEVSNLALSIGKGYMRHSHLYTLFGDDEWDREWLEWYEKDVASVNPAQLHIDRTEGLWGAYEGLVQFGVGFMGAGGVLKGAGVATQGGRLYTAGRAAVQGGIADLTVFDAQEERLADMVAGTRLENPLSRALEADPDDSEAIGRLKNVAEGGMAGMALDGLLAFVRGARAFRAARKGNITPDEAQKIADEALEEARRATDEADIAGMDTGESIPLYRYEVDAETGRATMKVNEAAEGRLPEGAPREQEFETPQEASRATQSLNLLDEVRREAPKPDAAGSIQLTPGQRAQVRATMARIASGTDPRDAERLMEGIDFNFGRVTSEEQTRGIINALSEALDEEFASATNRASEGNGRTLADIVKDAEDMLPGMSGEAMVSELTRIRGTTNGLENTITAARIMMYGQARRLTKLAESVDLDPSNTLVVKAMVDELDDLANLAVELSGAKADIARTLRSMGIDVSDEGLEAITKNAGEGAEAALVAKPRQRHFATALRNKKLSAEEIAALARGLQMTQNDPHSVLRLMRLTGDANTHLARLKGSRGTFDRIMNFRVAMMLSGPKTHTTNFASSALNAVILPVETILQGAIRGDAAITRQGWDELTGPFAQGGAIFRDAAYAAKQAWNENRSILDPQFLKNDYGVEGVAGNAVDTWYRKVLQAPNRALMTGDEFIKRTSYLAHVRAQSMRNAREVAEKNGFEMTLDQMRARVAADMARSVDEGGEALWYNSLQRAREATFTQKLHKGSIGAGVQSLVNSSPFMRIFLPFVRTPVNIFNHALVRTPLLSRATKEVQAMRASGDPDQIALAQAREASGLFMYSLGGMLAASDRITGKGPDNPALRAQKLDAGWQPYSIRFGDKYVSYRRMEPIATPIAIMADAFEAYGEMDEVGLSEAATSLFAASMASASSKSFLVGLVDFFEMASSGQAHTVQNFTENLASSFSPALLRQMNNDSVWREAEGVVNRLRAGLPGFSQQLEPRRNLFGEPVYRTARQAFSHEPDGENFVGYLNDVLNPMAVVDGSDIDDVLMELAELGKSLAMPLEKISNGQIDLRDGGKWTNIDSSRTGQSPYDRWMELVNEPKHGGPNLRTSMVALMRSDAWKNAPTSSNELYPGGMHWRMANRLIEEHTNAAFVTMLQEYPEIQQAIQTERQSAVDALLGR